MIDLADRQQLADYLKAHHLWLDTRSGQHFLVDRPTLDLIIEAAELKPDDTVVEIGPGAGTLSQVLAAHLPSGLVLAIERDARFVALLREQFKGTVVKVIHDDILRFDLARIEAPHYKLVSNLPYQITGVVLRRFLDPTNAYPPAGLVLMLQKEVVDRLLARPGSSDRGMPTILLELYGTARRVCNLPAQAFFPAPEVDSAVIAVVPHHRFQPDEASQILVLAKAGFAAKRRTLGNSLSATLRIEKKQIEDLLEKATIPHLHRAEDLSLEDWQRLNKVLTSELLQPKTQS